MFDIHFVAFFLSPSLNTPFIWHGGSIMPHCLLISSGEVIVCDRTGMPEFEFCFCWILSCGTHGNLTFLSLNFILYKMQMMQPSVIVRLKHEMRR